MLAAKHFDPLIGIDIHLIVPPGLPPVPIPHPHIGIVLDPFDYVPIIGGTVDVNGLKRAQAGTNGIAIPPHIPIGGVFAKPPTNESEIFMGSSTVTVDGMPFSYMALPVLSCQDIGMVSPPRPKGSPVKSLVLPTTVVIAIPSGPPVLVGGAPTVSLFLLAMRGAGSLLGKAFKKFKKSAKFKRFKDGFQKFRKKLFKDVKPGFMKCKVLRAEPVDITTGEVVVEQQDFELPGPLPLAWTRYYRSQTERSGACGPGWQTPADARLIWEADGAVMFYDGTPGGTLFPELPQLGEVKERVDGAVLEADGGSVRVRLKSGLSYEFAKPQALQQEVLARRICDRCGNSWEFIRDGEGLQELRSSFGLRLAVRSRRGRIEEIGLHHPDDSAPRPLVRYQYDAAGDLTAVLDQLDAPYCFSYRNHGLVEHTDRNGLSFYYEYQGPGPLGRVVHAWGDQGLYDYRFEYDEARGLVTVTDSLGGKSRVELDDSNLPVSETDPLGGVTRFEYDEYGRTTAVVAPGGLRTAYHYDASGNLLKLVRPDGVAVETEFDAQSQPVALRDGNGQLWRQEWDARGLLVSQVSPTGATRRYGYDAAGNLAEYTDELGAVTLIQVDRAGRVRGVIDPMGHATRFDVDVFGNVLEEVDPLGRRTEYRYDQKLRLVGLRRPSGAELRCGYDREDNLTEYRDEEDRLTRLSYFGLGEVACRHQPDGHTVRYHYDTEERLVGLTNQRGETYHLKRDLLGRIIEEIDYWGQPRKYTYDAAGHLARSEDALNRIIKYQSDKLGRLTKKFLPDDTVEHFEYDGNGNLIGTRNIHCTVARQFDADGRLIEEQQNDFVLKNAYDAAGNRIRRESSHGNVVEYRYDPLGRATEIQINGGDPIKIDRDAAGQTIKETLAPGLVRRYGYTPDGQIASQAVHADEREIIYREYDYDRSGELIRRTDSRWGVDQFLYDPMGRVRKHIDPAGKLKKYLHDPHGDLLRKVCQSDGTGPDWERVCEHEGNKYHFDATGNLVQKSDRAVSLNLQWDTSNRLINSQQGAGPRTEYGYDPQGKRTFKETNGQRTSFYWDGDALLVDEIGGKPSREYVYYPDTFRPAVILINGNVYFFAIDPNGAPSELMNSQGIMRHSDMSFRIENDSSTDIFIMDSLLRFQGQYLDIETGLHYNRHRYYDPSILSFTSVDPLGLIAGENLYQYAPNPLQWIDPLGLSCLWDRSAGRWRNRETGRFQRIPSDPSELVHNGRISFNSINEWARQQGLSNVWTPSSNFSTGGFKYQTTGGGFNYSTHGHGINPNAVAHFPGSNAARGPTSSITRRPISGTGTQNFRTNGTWGSFGSDPNGAHIPMDHSPY